jgi:hypothetical protein
MDRLQRLFRGAGMGDGQTSAADIPVVDTSEVIHVSSLALLKVTTTIDNEERKNQERGRMLNGLE